VVGAHHDRGDGVLVEPGRQPAVEVLPDLHDLVVEVAGAREVVEAREALVDGHAPRRPSVAASV
jgi:hypothetical protein